MQDKTSKLADVFLLILALACVAYGFLFIAGSSLALLTLGLIACRTWPILGVAIAFILLIWYKKNKS